MKKQGYIAPQVQCIVLETASIIAASLGYGGDKADGNAEVRGHEACDDEW